MKLLRGIRRWDMLALMLNATIGGGIYGLSSQVFAKSGSYSLLAMLVCVVVITLIIACFAEVGSRFRDTGGPVLYAHEAFGPFAGFMTGWFSLLLRIIGMAAIANICISYLGFFVPFAQTDLGRSIFTCLLFISLCYINLLGIKESVLFNNIFTIGKIATLLFFVTVGLFFIKTENYDFDTPISFESFSSSVLLMVYAFSGFTGAVTTAGEMKNPEADIPYSLFTVQMFKVVLYMLIQVVCIGTLTTLGQSEKPLTDAASNFLPGWGGIVITTGALISFIATFNGGVLVASRICFAMADKNLLPAFMRKVHPRFQTPHVALFITCGIMLLLTLTNSLLFLLTVNAIGTLLIYIVTCASLIKLRKTKNISPATFMLPAGNAIAGVSILFCILILLASTKEQVVYTLCLLGSGVMVYWISVLRKKKLMLATDTER